MSLDRKREGEVFVADLGNNLDFSERLLTKTQLEHIYLTGSVSIAPL